MFAACGATQKKRLDHHGEGQGNFLCTLVDCMLIESESSSLAPTAIVEHSRVGLSATAVVRLRYGSMFLPCWGKTTHSWSERPAREHLCRFELLLAFGARMYRTPHVRCRSIAITSISSTPRAPDGTAQISATPHSRPTFYPRCSHRHRRRCFPRRVSRNRS